MKTSSPDDVCARYAGKGIRIAVTDLDELVLVEGTAEALAFLGELFTVMSHFSDSGFAISPCSAGRALFLKGSTRGFYIHRLKEGELPHGLSQSQADVARATRRTHARRPKETGRGAGGKRQT